MIVWDWGRWSPGKEADAARTIADGELHFDLEGEKLRGRFVLVRPDRSPAPSEREQWLLLHKHDEFAVDGWHPEALPRSVKSGRTNDEVAAAPESLWRSDLPADRAEQRLRVDVPAWSAPDEDALADLDALGKQGEWELEGRALRLTNLDKVPFPPRPGDPPVTKRDLIRYAALAGRWMLPYLWDRPVNRRRASVRPGRPPVARRRRGAPLRAHCPSAWAGRRPAVGPPPLGRRLRVAPIHASGQA